MRKKRLLGSFLGRIIEEPNDRKTGKPGFTLPEIVAVVFFLGLLLIPVMATLARALMVSNEVEYLTVATFLAVEKIEEARARANCYTDKESDVSLYPANNCPVSDGSLGGDPDYDFDFEENLDNTCALPSPYGNYRCTVDYELSNINGLDRRVAEIHVRVWYDRNGDNSWNADEPDVLLETMVSMRPPIW